MGKTTYRCLECKGKFTCNDKGHGRCRCNQAKVTEDKYGFYNPEGSAVRERDYDFLTMFDEVNNENKD